MGPRAHVPLPRGLYSNPPHCSLCPSLCPHCQHGYARLEDGQAVGVYVGRKHAITCKLMRQRYLECRPLSYSNPVEYELLWGPRAHLETTKMKALEYMARLYRKQPQDWPEQYREAVEDEEARARSEATAMFFFGPM